MKSKEVIIAPRATSLHFSRTSGTIRYKAANSAAISKDEIAHVAAPGTIILIAAIQALNTREISSRKPTPSTVAKE